MVFSTSAVAASRRYASASCRSSSSTLRLWTCRAPAVDTSDGMAGPIQSFEYSIEMRLDATERRNHPTVVLRSRTTPYHIL